MLATCIMLATGRIMDCAEMGKMRGRGFEGGWRFGVERNFSINGLIKCRGNCIWIVITL